MKPKSIVFLVDILLTALVLWMGFNIYQTWARAKGPEARPDADLLAAATREEVSPERPKSASEYRVIINRDMFKTHTDAARISPKRAPQKVTAAVARQGAESRFKLKGTVLEGQGDAHAIILNEKENKQTAYRLNDYVGEARIEEITADSVTLDLEGEKQVLSLSFERGAGSRRTALRPRRAPVRRSVRRLPPQRRISRRPQPAPPAIAVDEEEEEDWEEEPDLAEQEEQEKDED